MREAPISQLRKASTSPGVAVGAAGFILGSTLPTLVGFLHSGRISSWRRHLGHFDSGRAQGDGTKVTEREREPKTQRFAENRRFSQIHPFSWKFKHVEGADFRRKPPIFADWAPSP